MTNYILGTLGPVVIVFAIPLVLYGVVSSLYKAFG